MTEMTRRSALRGAGLAVGTLAVASALPGGVLDPVDAFAADTTAKTSLTPEQALVRLKAGNRRFVSGRLRHPRRESHQRAAVAEGQAPFAVVLGCADSRVPPEVIYDQGLGDLFVTRIAGNTATDPYVIGTVEYGAADVGVSGRDTLLERRADLYTPVDLGIGKCRLVVAGPKGVDAPDAPRVATKYPRIAEAHFASESGFSQYLECAINSSLADRRVFLLHESIKIFIREVFLGAQKNLQDEVALGGTFQPVLLNVFKKYFLFFRQLLSRGHDLKGF